MRAALVCLWLLLVAGLAPAQSPRVVVYLGPSPVASAVSIRCGWPSCSCGCRAGGTCRCASPVAYRPPYTQPATYAPVVRYAPVVVQPVARPVVLSAPAAGC